MKRMLLLLLLASTAFAQTTYNEVSAGYTYEDLADDFEEAHLAVRFGLGRGPVIVRVSNADDDQLIEVEAYPKLAPKTYAYLAGGVSTESRRYPDWRFGAELFHGFGTWEASAGIRRLEFADPVDIQTVSLGKYIGNWLIIGRAYHADDYSLQAQVRRYFDDAGSYVALRAGTGREDIRTGPDVESLENNEIVGEIVRVFPSRWTFNARAGVTHLGEGDNFTGAVAVGRRF